MNTETLRQIFQSPFNYSEYSRKIVHDLFGCNDVYETLDSAERLNPTPDGDQNFFLGRMEDSERQLLGFFYTRVAEGSDVRRKRVGLWKLIQPYLKYEVEAAIAVFDDGQHWRLSYIYDHKKGTTSAKRFSYILGDRQGQFKTPMERLDRVAAKVGLFKLDDLKEAFSVDALSKEFFDEYHRHYDRIIAELARQGNTGAVFHDYVKKMMGRIVFLHFLQKKGWLNDDPEFLSKLFFLSPYKQDFLEQELEPLFFGIFNTEPDKREQLFHQEHWDLRWLVEWEKLPYLNGGLFERDEVDKMKIKLSASLFENLFKFMASYNFTIDENDPDDADIGIDPEMLGKIFESLLEDNKAKGAFYTPKEIVRYMCKESLIAYLNSKVNSDEVNSESKENQITNHDSLVTAVRQFVEQHEFPEELESYREVLDTALRNVKICDPAIGSGAFPMGLLNELWRCREALGERATSPSQMGTQATGLSQAGSLCSKEGQAGSLYPYSRAALKREIIENNIYGVDIERGAIDIARLRFWLSIVVDAEKPEPLPNFDYKFMQGNSLIESFDGHDLSHIMDKDRSNRSLPGRSTRKAGWGENQTGMEFGSEEVKQNLRNWLKIYFSLTDHKEKAYYRELINSSVKNYIVQQGIGPAAENRLNAIDPSANKHFFLWHTWFKDIFENGGFDIVIGNPPYGANIDDLTLVYEKIYPETSEGFKDIYKYFYNKCFNLLKSNGFLCLITPNTFLRQPRYGDLRRLILKNSVVQILDLGENVFDAVVPVAILLAQKAVGKDLSYVDLTKMIDIKTALTAIKFKKIEQKTYYSTRNNIFIEDIRLNKDKEVSLDGILSFKDAGINYQRVNVGLKEKGKSDLSSRLLYEGIRENDDDVEFWKGVDINSYFIEGKTNRFCRKNIYLKPNERVVLNDVYFSIAPKLLWRQTAQYPIVTIDYKGVWFGRSIQAGIIKDEYKNKISYEYLCGLLNSTYLRALYENSVKETGRVFPQVKLEKLKPLPIVIPSPSQQQSVEKLVKCIFSMKEKDSAADTSMLEREIDIQVYTLYNLTPEEIAIIEQNN